MEAVGASGSAWVRGGHTHYSAAAAGKCPYCQQKLPAAFEADIASCFDAQYQQDIRDLGQFKSTYEAETAEIVRELKANMSDVLETVDLKTYQEKFSPEVSVRTSMADYKKEEWLVNLPLYAIDQVRQF